MFAESMLETSWAQRGRRSWTTLTSFGLQMVAIAVLLAVPLIKTVGMPNGHVLRTPTVWGAPPAAPPRMEHLSPTTVIQSNLADNQLIEPPSIPPHVEMLNEIEPPPQVSYNNNGSGVEDSTGPGSPDGVWKMLSDSASHVAPPPPSVPKPASRPLVSSRLLQGSLIHRVDPPYPQIAKAAGIQGAVVLEAIVGKDGSMENLRLVSGHPLLVRAAIDAVSQWRYKPYVLNGDAIEVETQITVNFILAR